MSLIVKPIQRVLKYPLLLRELKREILLSWDASKVLTVALTRMEYVAEKINLEKKYLETVEKYLEPRQTSLVYYYCFFL